MDLLGYGAIVCVFTIAMILGLVLSHITVGSAADAEPAASGSAQIAAHKDFRMVF